MLNIFYDLDSKPGKLINLINLDIHKIIIA